MADYDMNQVGEFIMRTKTLPEKIKESREVMKYDDRPMYEVNETSVREELGYRPPPKQTIFELRENMKVKSAFESPLKEWWKIKENAIITELQCDPVKREIPIQYQAEWKRLLTNLGAKKHDKVESVKS